MWSHKISLPANEMWRLFLSLSPADEFARIYETEVEYVYGFHAYRTGFREVAEDLTQTTFERALAAWDRFDSNRASPRTWLLAIANNLLADHYRRSEHRLNRRFSDTELEGDAFQDPTSRDSDLEISAGLANALGELDERSRRLIALRFGADLTGPEIAEMTELSLANVQQILSRAIRQLRELLDPEAEVSDSGSKGT